MRPLFKRFSPLFIVIALVLATPALALDSADISTMLNNKVPENAIINMVQSQGGIVITQHEIDQLPMYGASNDLTSFLAQYVQAPQPQQAQTYSTTTVVSSSSQGSVLTPAPIVTTAAYPPLYDKEGWLAISNRDWVTYYLSIDQKEERMFLSRDVISGGLQLPPSQTVVVNIKKEGYKLYGSSGEKLEVKVREGLATTLTLEPFGTRDNPGLTGIAVDRDKTRSATLIAPYVPQPVVITQPAPVIIERPAPVYIERPAPVYVVPGPRPPPPYYYYRGPGPRRYYYR